MAASNSRGFLARLWHGFWRIVDGVRRVTVNLLFVLLVIAIAVWVFSAPPRPVIKPDTTLVLQPQGRVVEAYTGTPLERAVDRAFGQERPETRLRDLIDSLRHARADERVAQVLLDVRQLWSIGLGSLQELESAVAEFKQSDKRIYAIGGFMTQDQYYLAGLADEVWIEPGGVIWLDGFARYRNYYKDGLDKLAVDINLFRVGEFKSAMEPYVRNDMSPEAEQANSFLIDGLWQQYLERVALNRGLPLEVLDAAVNDYAARIEAAGGDATALALELGLVDRVMAGPELRDALAQSGAADSRYGFRQVSFRDYLQAREPEASGSDQVAVIVAEGEIVAGDGPAGTAGSAEVSRQIRRAAADDKVKAVVLRIDSPGGDAHASEVIRRELANLRRSGKPVIASMGDLAASGGYWIAMGADEVWSNAGTITGSIGIWGMLPTFQDTLGKIGVSTDGVGTTPLSGSLRLDRELGDDARRMIQALTEDGYEKFITLVSKSRQMTTRQVRDVARGRVWSGSQALERNLIDHAGGLRDAAAAAARRAGLGDDYRLTWVQPEMTAVEKLVAGLMARVEYQPAGIAAPRSVTDMLPGSLRERIAADLRLLLPGRRAPGILAHCLCVTP